MRPGPALLWEVTARCDRSCAHCYNVWRHDPSYGGDELSWSELCALVPLALERLRPSSVTIIGGEPLLHDRLFDLVALFASLGAPPALSTHGGHVGCAEARHLVRAGLAAAEISLGADPHDEAALTASSRALQHFEQAGLAASASVVLSRPSLGAMDRLLLRSTAFGAAGVVLQPLVEPRQGALPAPLVPSPGELHAVLRDVAHWSERTRYPVQISGVVAPCSVPAEVAWMVTGCCRCGASKRCVDPAGRMRRCEIDPEVVGDLRRWLAADSGDVPTPSPTRPHRPKPPRVCATCAHEARCVGPCDKLVASRRLERHS